MKKYARLSTTFPAHFTDFSSTARLATLVAVVLYAVLISCPLSLYVVNPSHSLGPQDGSIRIFDTASSVDNGRRGIMT